MNPSSLPPTRQPSLPRMLPCVSCACTRWVPTRSVVQQPPQGRRSIRKCCSLDEHQCNSCCHGNFCGHVHRHQRFSPSPLRHRCQNSLECSPAPPGGHHNSSLGGCLVGFFARVGPRHCGEVLLAQPRPMFPQTMVLLCIVMATCPRKDLPHAVQNLFRRTPESRPDVPFAFLPALGAYPQLPPAPRRSLPGKRTTRFWSHLCSHT